MGAFEPASGAGGPGSESSSVRAAAARVLIGQSEADMLIAALLKIMSQLGIPCIVVGSDGDLLILECDGGTVVRCLQPAGLVPVTASASATSTTQAAKGGAYLTRAPPPPSLLAAGSQQCAERWQNARVRHQIVARERVRVFVCAHGECQW